MNNVKTALKIILLLIAVGLLLFILITCVQGTSSCQHEAVYPNTPSVAEAPFKVTVKATGNIYYSKLVVTVGVTHTLKGYWEIVNDAYVFKDIAVVLNEAEFGEIIVERRK